MGHMVYSLLWVMQDLYHQPYGSSKPSFVQELTGRPVQAVVQDVALGQGAKKKASTRAPLRAPIRDLKEIISGFRAHNGAGFSSGYRV